MDDGRDVLTESYHPVGLTAILVHSDSAVASVQTQADPWFQASGRAQATRSCLDLATRHGPSPG